VDKTMRDDETPIGPSSGPKLAHGDYLFEHEEPASLVAAWDVACTLAAANWFLQIALLKLEELDLRCFQASLTIRRLAVEAKGLIGPVVEKDLLKNFILTAWSESEFTEERQPGLKKGLEVTHLQVEQKLRDCRRDYDKFRSVHEEECLRIISPCRAIVDRIESELERCMRERQRRVYRLGRMLEQVTLRHDAYNDTFLWCIPVEDGGTFEQERFLAPLSPGPKVGRVTWDWLLELKSSLRDCGLPERMDPPEDDLWLPRADDRLIVRLENDGIMEFSINYNLKKYQIDKFKARIREAFARGVGALTSSPVNVEVTSSDQPEELDSGRLKASTPSPNGDEWNGANVSVLEPEERKRLLELKAEIDPAGDYLGESDAILRVFGRIEEFNIEDRDNRESNRPAKSVLILGPTGAGKTELAALIHRHSGRPREKFAVERATDSSLEGFTAVKSRWVGYGKYPGFDNYDKQGDSGLLQEWAGGTIFLDEVADLPGKMQEFLMQILDSKDIPLTSGKGEPVKTSARLIFATNQDLEKAVEEGRFRPELLDRIKRRTIWIPPLSERKEDIFAFVDAKCGDYRPTSEFLLALLMHTWPGNVREILDTLAWALVMARKNRGLLKLDNLKLSDPTIVHRVRTMTSEDVEAAVLSKLAQTLRQRGFKTGKRGHALQKEMARILRTSEATLSRSMRDLGLSGDRPGDDVEGV
jgi:DNA-binding NtrC family response regulator